MARFLMAMLSFCLLLPITCLHAGKVKTIDGKEMPKDSVVELDIHEFFQSYHFDSCWWAVVREVDTVALYKLATRKGEMPVDPDSVFKDPSNIEKLVVSGADVGWAKKLGKVHLMPGSHDLRIRCVGMFSKKDGTMLWVHSLPIPLSFTGLAGHRYRLGAAIVGTDWSAWIADKDSKDTVASTTQLSK